MKLANAIAWRYFRGKKSAQAINIISWISMGAIAVATAGMIVLFSVFNGLEGVMHQLYAVFYPDVKVAPAKGKFFTLTKAQQQAIKQMPGIAAVSYSIEDLALLSGNDEQRLATLKGVDNNWFTVSGIDTFIEGSTTAWTQPGPLPPAISGLLISAALGIDNSNVFSRMELFYPQQGNAAVVDPRSALNSLILHPEGYFSVQEEFDGRYVLTTLAAARQLFNLPQGYSSVEIKLSPGATADRVKRDLSKLLGADYVVLNRLEQNKTLFLIMKGEKWAVYAIFLLVLVIASFNMIGSLSMLVIEKKKDITILKSMGATSGLIRRLFLVEGLLLAMTGGGIGLCLGLLVCAGQYLWGWIQLPPGFIIEAYPVAIHFTDIILVLVTAFMIGLLAALYPAARAAVQPVQLREE